MKLLKIFQAQSVLLSFRNTQNCWQPTKAETAHFNPKSWLLCAQGSRVLIGAISVSKYWVNKVNTLNWDLGFV